MQDFAANLAFDDLPEPVLHILRRSFADTLGVAAVGSTTPMARIAATTAAEIYGPTPVTQSRMMFDGRQVGPAGAAMGGAMLVDSIDAHDGTSFCKGHAGSALFPSLLALADTAELTGSDLAVLLALGYEISYRAGRTQHATCADYHTSGAWTAVGVAAMTARFLGCDADRIHQAAGIGEYHGPRSQMMRCIDHPTMVRDGVGWGAPSGITAGYLAKNGFTGAPALTCQGPFWDGLGDNWLTVSDTHYKPYPCCRWAHPSLDAVKALMESHQLHHTQVESVQIKTFHNATRLAGHTPITPDEFAYSIAFPVAAMIVRGQVGVDELAPQTLTDPEILRISRATTLIDDDHFTRISDGVRWAQVDITLTDGTVLSDAPRTPRGDPDAPLSDAEMSTKFHLFSDPVVGVNTADQIESLALNFDQLDAAGVRELLNLVLVKPTPKQ
ncbi:MAG: MmgE/PrpD family protein [Planktomarina sp.]